MIEYVCGFLVRDDLIALIRKVKPKWQAGKLNGVGGKIEPGETPMQAMSREWLEESGVPHESWEHAATIGKPGWLVHFFVGRAEQLHTFKAAVEQVTWYFREELPADVIPNLRWLVPMCLDEELERPVQVRYR